MFVDSIGGGCPAAVGCLGGEHQLNPPPYQYAILRMGLVPPRTRPMDRGKSNGVSSHGGAVSSNNSSWILDHSYGQSPWSDPWSDRTRSRFAARTAAIPKLVHYLSALVPVLRWKGARLKSATLPRWTMSQAPSQQQPPVRAHIYSHIHKVSDHCLRLAFFLQLSSSLSSIMELHMSTQQREDLNKLVDIFNRSPWLHGNILEPRIGDPDTPKLAEAYGARGRSCFIVFVHEWGNGAYRCFHESCFRPIEQGGYSARSLEDAIRHQRYHHFYHSPFRCVPINGDQW